MDNPLRSKNAQYSKLKAEVILLLTPMGERGRNRERGRERGLQHFKTDFTLLIHGRFSLCVFLVHLTVQRHELACTFGGHRLCLFATA